MRLWSIHPRYLDAKGLVALWREGLLAQHALSGLTRGYRNHPQLERFKAQENPVAAINSYLRFILQEAERRNYRFDPSKIPSEKTEPIMMTVTRGQLEYEWEHLKKKLQQRSPGDFQSIRNISTPEPHPLFGVMEGPIEDWEKA